MFATNITPRSLTVVMGSLTRTIRETHPRWNETRDLLKGMAKDQRKVPNTEEEQRLIEWLDFPRHITRLTNGLVTITDRDAVLYKGEPVHPHLATRVVQHLNDGFDIGPLCRFIERLGLNPDKAVRDQLFRWLEETDMPITSDGHFLAYKYVRQDMKSSHDGKTLHEIGKPTEMKREDCDPDPDNHCSRGLHFAGWSYMRYCGGGEVKLLLKIDPVDVVCCPKDYEGKGRCCRYTPIAIINEDQYTGKREVDTRPLEPVPPPGSLVDDDPDELGLAEEVSAFDTDDEPIEMPHADVVPDDVVASGTIQCDPPEDVLPQAQLDPAEAEKVLDSIVDKPADKPSKFEWRGKKVTAKRIEATVEKKGSINGAARFLGIPRTTLQGWFRKLKGD